jgi:hypothetical protein
VFGPLQEGAFAVVFSEEQMRNVVRPDGTDSALAFLHGIEKEKAAA